MVKLKTKVLLDIITEYLNINHFIQQKLIVCERRNIYRWGTFFSKFRRKTFLQTKHIIYQSQHMVLVGLIVSFVLLKVGLVYVYQKEGLVYLY